MFQTTKQIYIYNGAKGTGDNSAVTNGNSCWFPQPAPTSPYLLTPLTPGFPDRVGRVGFLHVVGGSLGLVDQVRVEDVELVAWTRSGRSFGCGCVARGCPVIDAFGSSV